MLRIKFTFNNINTPPTIFNTNIVRGLHAFSSEVLEHIGDEYIGNFFGCCESVLTEGWIFVLQVIKLIFNGDFVLICLVWFKVDIYIHTHTHN